MMSFIAILHIIIAVVLVLLVLVQDSKGAMGATFGGGGGSNSLFGATGADNLLTKLTKGIVVVFAVTCILLTRFSSQHKDSVLDTEGVPAASPVTAPAENPAEPTNSEDPSTSQ